MLKNSQDKGIILERQLGASCHVKKKKMHNCVQFSLLITIFVGQDYTFWTLTFYFFFFTSFVFLLYCLYYLKIL